MENRYTNLIEKLEEYIDKGADFDLQNMNSDFASGYYSGLRHALGMVIREGDR